MSEFVDALKDIGSGAANALQFVMMGPMRYNQAQRQAQLEESDLAMKQDAMQRQKAGDAVLAESGGVINPEVMKKLYMADPQRAQVYQKMMLEQQQQEMMNKAIASGDPNAMAKIGALTGNSAMVSAAGQIRPNMQWNESLQRYVDTNSANPMGGYDSPVAAPMVNPNGGDGVNSNYDGLTPKQISEINADQVKTEIGTQKGRERVSSVLDDMRKSYSELDNTGTSVDDTKGALPNLVNSLKLSGLGQYVGGAVGADYATKTQEIESARPLIMSAIMQATGMNAKQLDSNKELQFYLNTLTDPSNTLQSRATALQRIESNFGLNRQFSSSQPQTQSVKPTPQTKTSYEGFKITNIRDK